MDFGTIFKEHVDTVGDLEAGGLTQVLDTVDELACDTFFDQFIVQFDVQRDREDTIVRYEPSRHIFGDNLDILGHYRVVES